MLAGAGFIRQPLGAAPSAENGLYVDYRPAGYGVARSRRYGAALLILIARITPALSYLIPWFLLFQQVGLANTYHALT